MSELDTKIPNNHVVGVIGGERSGEACVEELHHAGYDQAGLLGGRQAIDKIDAEGDSSGGLTALIKRVAGHLSEQVAYLEQYERAASKGLDIVAVKVENHDDAEKAKEVLERFGTTDIRFFGRFAVTDLTPASNPSAPSGEI